MINEVFFYFRIVLSRCAAAPHNTILGELRDESILSVYFGRLVASRNAQIDMSIELFCYFRQVSLENSKNSRAVILLRTTSSTAKQRKNFQRDCVGHAPNFERLIDESM